MASLAAAAAAALLSAGLRIETRSTACERDESAFNRVNAVVRLASASATCAQAFSTVVTDRQHAPSR